jgi:hypothetical protein
MAMTNRGMAGRVRRYGKRRAMRSWPLLLSMHLTSRDHGRPAAGRAIAIPCQEHSYGSIAELRCARNAIAAA